MQTPPQETAWRHTTLIRSNHRREIGTMNPKKIKRVKKKKNAFGENNERGLAKTIGFYVTITSRCRNNERGLAKKVVPASRVTGGQKPLAKRNDDYSTRSSLCNVLKACSYKFPHFTWGMGILWLIGVLWAGEGVQK